MKSRRFNKKASSTLEYLTLITFILAAFFVFQHYVARGFSGRWKAVGDSFGHGKQYDPRPFGSGGTLECIFDKEMNEWLATSCYERCGCSGDAGTCTIPCRRGCRDARCCSGGVPPPCGQ